jgi:hypothetical protein
MSRSGRLSLVLAGAALAALLVLLLFRGSAKPPEVPPAPPPAPASPPAAVVPPPAPAPPPAAKKPEEAPPAAGAVDPATTGAIVGVALALDGTPAAGARVRAAPDGDEARRVVATADADGSFRFEKLAPGRWTVACGGGGFGTRLDRKAEAAVADVVAGGEVRVEVRGQPLAVVHGRITGPEGEPVAGAAITVMSAAFLYPDGGAWQLPGKMGEDGTYEVKNVTPRSTVAIEVKAEGFADVKRRLYDLAPGARIAADFVLERGVILDLVLVAADDGTPVTKAIVWVQDARTGSLYAGPDGDAFGPDERGRIRVPGLRPMTVQVQIEAEGFVNVLNEKVDPATQNEPYTFRLVRGVEISGRVLRPDGTPYEDRDIRAFPEGKDDPMSILHSWFYVRTDKDGAFRIKGVPAGPYRVGVYDNHHEPLVSTVVEAGTSGIVLRVGEDSTRKGVLVRLADSEGRPVAKARIRTGILSEGGNLVSAGGGGYLQPEVRLDLEAGRRAFVEAWDAMDEAGRLLPLGHVFRIVPPDVPAEWVIRLPPERTVEGTVVGPGGKPIEGAKIEVVTIPGEGLSPNLSRELGSTDSRAGGNFRFGGLGEEKVQLTPSAEGHIGPPVTAEAGARGLVLSVAPEVRCELRILDPEGKPLEKVRVSAVIPTAEGDDPRRSDSVPTDAQGRVRLRGLLPGVRYRLHVFVNNRDHPGLLGIRRDGWVPESGDFRLERAAVPEGE